jgi:hypothetical protein
MRVIEIDEIDDDVLELLMISGKVKTEAEMMRKAMLDAIDPVNARGPEFEFETRPDGDEMWISLEVPESGATVDLAVAWTVAQLDARACALVLERDGSVEATLRVYRNTLGWLRFWAWRHPNNKYRAMFEAQLEERKAGLAELKRRAGMRFQFEILDELKTM